MARQKAFERETRRLSLNISKSVSDKLEALVEKTDADSLTEVIRRSVAVYDHVINETSKNKAELILRTADGEEKTVLLL